MAVVAKLNLLESEFKAVMKLAFIGGGNMAQALLAGLNNQDFNMSDITVVELDADKQTMLKEKFGVIATESLSELTTCETIVLAIKPQQLPALTKTLAPILKNQLVISIAAGVRLKDLRSWLNNHEHIVRAMPNTPAQIQAGITALYSLPQVSQHQISIADQILSAAGATLWVDSEDKLDAVTAISGSGPAYVFYLIEALQEAAVSLGLSLDEASQLSLETFKGAGLLAATSNTPVDQLRVQVTSKKGTTEQGLISLKDSKVKEAIILAAEKAHARAKTLADEISKAN